MANEAENAIYNRLASAPSFHPANADLLTRDWMLEPGDVVTVLSGEESYQVPIYSMNLEWRGDSKVSIESTGNQKREPLPALRRKQYGGGSATYKEKKRFTADLERVETDLGAKIGLVVTDNNTLNTAYVVAQINESGSSVLIGGDKVNISTNQAFTAVAQGVNRNAGNISTLQNTTSGLTNRVENAEGAITTLQTTANGLRIEVGKKSTVYPQFTDPALDLAVTLNDGDVWEKDSGIRTWSQFSLKKWNQGTQYNWKNFRGSEQYVLKNGQWELSSDHAEFEITREEINSTLESQNGDISTLKRTATELNSELVNAKGQISTIRQTADSVSIELANAKGDAATLKARFEITDSAITQEVTDRTNSERTMNSRITQTANSISQVVESVGSDGRVTAASIVAAVNNSGSSVKISADHIILDGDAVAAALFSKTLDTGDFTCDAITASGAANFYSNVTIDGYMIAEGGIHTGNVSAVSLNSHAINWTSQYVITSLTTQQKTVYSADGPITINVVSNFTGKTIYYLTRTDV